MNAPFFPRPSQGDGRSRGKPTVQFNGEEWPVRIRDLTAKGAQLECPESLSAGSIVTFKGATGRKTATVAWSTAGRMGVKFAEALTAMEVEAEFPREQLV